MHDKLSEALRTCFEMETGDARTVASTVLEIFAGESEVNDEDLDKDMRALFYSLERERLLSIRRTEYKFEGQLRRAFFWCLNQPIVEQFSEVEEWEPEEAHAAHHVYHALPLEVWERGKVNA